MRISIVEPLVIGLCRLLQRFDRRQPDPAELGTAAIRRILAMSNTAIGDTLMSTPALASLRRAYPTARIDLLVHPAYQALMDGHPDIDCTLSYDGRWAGFFAILSSLRRQQYDLVCLLHANEPQATPLAYLTGARWRFKLPNVHASADLLSNSEPKLNWAALGHGIDQRVAVAKLAGAKDIERRMRFAVTEPQRKAASDKLADWLDLSHESILIAFQAGASTASRRWPSANYAELGRRLLSIDSRIRIVITGSPAEASLTETIARDIDSPNRVVSSAGKIPLHQLPGLLAHCCLLVTPDTGIMHMAIALRIPVVALFAAADWRASGPTVDLELHRIIQKPRTCDPCLGKRCPYSAPICMDQITIEEVCEQVLALITWPKEPLA